MKMWYNSFTILSLSRESFKRILRECAWSNSLLIHLQDAEVDFSLFYIYISTASTYYFIYVKIERKLPFQDILTMYRLWNRPHNVSLLNGLESERPLRGITRSMTLFYLGNHIRSAYRVLKSPRAIPRWRVDLDLCAVTAVTVSRDSHSLLLLCCYEIGIRRDFFERRCSSLRDEILKTLYKIFNSRKNSLLPH